MGKAVGHVCHSCPLVFFTQTSPLGCLLVYEALCTCFSSWCQSHDALHLIHEQQQIFTTCVCSVLFCLQRRCMGVLCCYFIPNVGSLRWIIRALNSHSWRLWWLKDQFFEWLLLILEKLSDKDPVPAPERQLMVTWIRDAWERFFDEKVLRASETLPPPHQPVQHTPCLSCKLNMYNSSTCVILVPKITSNRRPRG